MRNAAKTLVTQIHMGSTFNEGAVRDSVQGIDGSAMASANPSASGTVKR
jgi:hypothetical protein